MSYAVFKVLWLSLKPSILTFLVMMLDFFSFFVSVSIPLRLTPTRGLTSVLMRVP